MKAKAVSARVAAKSVDYSKVTAFQKQVYELCSQIPQGKVSTYGALALAMNKPKASRAVGNALRHNPFAPTVPCHRVIASDRKLGGFMGSNAPSGVTVTKKLSMLKEEGIVFDKDGKVATECIISL